VESSDNSSIRDDCFLTISVLPLTKLAVKILDIPKYVLAGETYPMSFSVTNDSNSSNEIFVKLLTRDNISSIDDAIKIKLTAGESKNYTFQIKTNPGITSLYKHFLELTAQIPKDDKSKAKDAGYLDIIPRKIQAGDRFHRVPVSIETIGVSSFGGNDTVSGFQTEISGEGSLDEENEKHIGFLFRSPDIRDKLSYGKYDEYRVSFRTENYNVEVGDNNYRLSPLTELHTYGRGIKNSMKLRNFLVGSQYQESRWINPVQRMFASNIDYIFNKNNMMGMGYIKKTGFSDIDLMNLNGEFRLAKNTYTELEYAFGNKDGKTGNAYRLNLYDKRQWFSYNLNYVHGGPDYPGYYRDVNLLTTGLEIPVGKRLGLDTSFRQYKNNLDLNEKKHSARFERGGYCRLNYRPLNITSLSFTYSREMSKDLLPKTKFDYSGNIYRLGISQNFRWIDMNASYEYKSSLDHLTDRKYKTDTYNFYTYFKPTNGQSYGGYIQYRENDIHTWGNFRNLMIGLNATIRIIDKIFLEINFQRDTYLKEEFWDRKSLSTKLSYTFYNNHRIFMQNYYNAYGNKNINDLIFGYTAKFGIPTRHKAGIGAIKGYVHNGDTKKAIPDVIVRLNNLATVTDKSGHFTFSPIKTGIYYLDVNPAKIGLDYVTTEKSPMEVTVEDGKKSLLDIEIVQSASIAGRVIIYKFGENGNHYDHSNFRPSENNNLHVSRGAGNIIIEIRDGKEIKREYTDREGYFNFPNLRPGKWTLKVYEYGLPEYHYLEKDTFEMELKSGEKMEINVKVLPKIRQIKIIEKDEIIQEETLE